MGDSSAKPAVQLHSDEQKISTPAEKIDEERQAIYDTLNKLQEEGVVLRQLFEKASSELSNLKKPALLVSEVLQVFGDKAVIRLPNGNKFYCYIAQNLKDIKIGDAVLVEQKTLNVVEKISISNNEDIEKFVIVDKPETTWKDIGGLTDVVKEVQEVIELPLTKPHLFKKVGIKPPKGILLYGPPGTGKTILAKAVANSTKASFIEVVGSELVQKFIGEGAKLVKEIFELARKKAPSIVFIDEIDALAATRMENGTSGEREVNRTFMQLLAELDGFNHLDNVKVIGATNRADILDQAVIRPGRLDRLIEVGLPNEEGCLEILKVHTREMNLKGVKLKDLPKEMANFSGAEIMAACTEAGYFAIRNDREHVTHKDFLNAIEKVRFTEEEDNGARMIG